MVLGSREQGAEEKHFRELGRKVIFLSGSREQRPPPPGRASDFKVFTIYGYDGHLGHVTWTIYTFGSPFLRMI